MRTLTVASAVIFIGTTINNIISENHNLIVPWPKNSQMCFNQIWLIEIKKKYI